MVSPLLTTEYQASEYICLFKDAENMNFYSTKIEDKYYVLVDDYDIDVCNTYSEDQIFVLEENRLLYKQNDKYGVVDTEGLIVVPFVYDKFERRNDKYDENRCNVLLDNR